MSLRKPPALVFDIGEAYTKCGVVGDNKPRIIFPTDLSRTSASLTLDKKPVGFGVSIASRGWSEEEWMKVLKVHFRMLYFNHMIINPSDRNVIVCENQYWPYAFKNALARVLFELGVPGVLFIPATPAPLYLTGKESGLVVELGHHETRVVPAASGFQQHLAMCMAAVGMAAVIKKARELAPSLSEEDLVELVPQGCFVRAGDDEKEGTDFVITAADGTTKTLPGKARSHAADALFGHNPEGENLAEVICECLMSIDVDARADVVNNVFVCGGTSSLPGFTPRLLQELDDVLALPKFSKLSGLKGRFTMTSTPFDPDCASFIAVSMIGGLIAKNEDSFITQEKFDDKEAWVVTCGKDPKEKSYIHPEIPDWTLPVEEEDEYYEDEEPEKFMIF